ncbi:DNA gyrase inhibitor YacG [Iodidimonas gelatinilytica]|uniref:DNA gyrase inhibitor YacG n=2 Tax=Iodidimonas gelatinilytica TaxID=1236966 RepID=A0A5A7N457_9PROT|nr:DNA gyrase inhibitor YacG [Iodidimonas gelatinilytica]
MSGKSPAGKKPRCPMCKKPVAEAYRPFCSDRCSKLDLARWFGEAYVLPGERPFDGADLDEEKNSFQSLWTGSN